jgi:hypothetical protein
MVERRKKPRQGSAEAHPLAKDARLATKVIPSESARAPSEPIARERVTFLLPTGLIDRVRDAVHGTPGETMAGLVSRSLERTVDEMENARGTAFRRRRQPLKAGRPRK